MKNEAPFAGDDSRDEAGDPGSRWTQRHHQQKRRTSGILATRSKDATSNKKLLADKKRRT